MQIHELDNFKGEINEKAYLAVDNGTDTGKVSSDELLADVKSDVAQLDGSLNARIDNIVAGGTAPSTSEIVDARLGFDGRPYSSLGASIRGQANELSDEISGLSENGVFIDSVSWEHGGIDNATGQNSNDGSTTRSRVNEYMLCSDYKSISSTDTSQFVWIIYYNEDKTFVGAAQLRDGSTDISQAGYFFRLDYRRGLDYTYNIKLYKYAEFKKNIDEIETSTESFEAVLQSLKTEPTVSWEQGTLSDSTGNPGGNLQKNRIRFSDFLEIPKKNTLRLSARQGFIFQVYTWNADKIYQGVTENISTYAHFYDEAAYIKVVMKKSSDENISPAEGANLSVNIIGVPINEETPTSANIPSYWGNAISETENSINEALASDEFAASFAFVTDTHADSNQGYSGELMNKVMTDCHIPVWFHGGDAVTGLAVVSKDDLIAEMNKDFEQFSMIENIGLRAIGNHDPAFGTSNYNYNLKNSEINHYYHGIDREKYLQIYGDKKGYFYKDIHKDKLRCVVLDIIQYESQVNAEDLVTGSNKLNYHQFGSKQLAWFADVLGNTPKGYSVVVCSHIAPVSLSELKSLDSSWSESVPIDYIQARKIAEAYKLKTTYSFSGTVSGDTTGDVYDISVDYTSANGEFVCFFCGHTHKDFNLTLDNVLIVGTANDSLPRSINASSYAPIKTAKTDTEHIIDFFCIKPSTHEIDVVRLGAYLAQNGKIRSMAY